MAVEDDLPYEVDPTVFFTLNYEKYNITFRNNVISIDILLKYSVLSCPFDN